MTIIRGGLSLPWPTARNMPMPSSRARSGSMTSIQRPCFSASARASSARTSGLTSFAERFESVRAQFAPSPMIIASLGGLRQRRRVLAGRDEDQLVELRRGAFDVRRGRGASGRTSPRRRRGRRARRRPMRHRRGRRRAARSRPRATSPRGRASRRSADGADRDDRLAVELRRRRRRRPSRGAPRGSSPGRGDGRPVSACP